MPSFYWIKLYHEILSDPKMGRLPDRVWRRCIECFLMAGELDDGGFLPPVADMAWKLRTDEQELNDDLLKLAQNGIIEERDGRWFVVHFSERQDAMSDAERKSRERERRRKQEYYQSPPGDTHGDRGCHKPVTNRDTDKIREDIDRDTDKRREDNARENVAELAAKVNEIAPEQATPPATPAHTVSTSFQEWSDKLEKAEAKNRPVILRDMFVQLFPHKDAPTYAWLGKVARDVGGAGRLAELMWQVHPRPPTGEVLRFIVRMAKGGNGTARHQEAQDGKRYLEAAKRVGLDAEH